MGHVPHLFVRPPWSEPQLSVDAETVHHLQRVLRSQAGRPVTYTDGQGMLGTGSWDGTRVVRGEETEVARPVPRLTVACATPKARERQRFIVEKLAELGVARVQWLRCEHSLGRPVDQARQAAWAAAALQQSRGAYLLESAGEVSWSDLEEPIVIADASGGSVTELPVEPATFVVGPEGGLTAAELERSTFTLSLGPTILRTDTAAVAGAAVLLAHTGWAR